MKFVAPLKENCVFSCLALCREDRVMRRFLLGAALFDDFVVCFSHVFSSETVLPRTVTGKITKRLRNFVFESLERQSVVLLERVTYFGNTDYACRRLFALECNRNCYNCCVFAAPY